MRTARGPRDGRVLNVRVLLSFQQPTFQKFVNDNDASAAWPAFHTKRVVTLLLQVAFRHVGC